MRARRFDIQSRLEAYDNGVTDLETSESFWMGSHVVADDFELVGARQVHGAEVDWETWGGWTRDIEWFVFADAGGQPGGPVASGVAVPESMSTTWLGEFQGNQWYRTFFLFDQAVELEPAPRYWFGVHWAAPGDCGGCAVLAAASTSQSGSYSMESLNGTFDSWTSNQLVDRAFRLHAPTPPSTSSSPCHGDSHLARRNPMRRAV